MCDKCKWKEAMALIDEMLSDSDYNFANDILTGIQSWVEENEYITERQITAIDNIYNSIIQDRPDDGDEQYDAGDRY